MSPRPGTTERAPRRVRTTARLLLASCLVLAGCQQFTPPATAYQMSVQRVAFESPAEMPAVEFEGFPGGKTGAAALAGGGIFLACTAQLVAGTGCAGPYCPGLVAIVAGLCGVTALATGAYATARTPSLSAQAHDREAAGTALAANAMQEALKAQLAVTAAQRGVTVDPGGADTVLEAQIVRIGASGNELMRPHIAVRARLLRAADRHELTTFAIEWRGAMRERRQWLADDASALREALDAGYVEVARAVVDRAFFLYPFPDRHPHVDRFAPRFGLGAEEPSTHAPLSMGSSLPASVDWSLAKANPPRLRWQAFPRRSDRETNSADMARVTNVRYDLVIARARHDVPAEVVYRREGLPAPEHQVEAALEADARYFWTVRARFTLDGRERVTEWSAMHQGDFESATAPTVNAFRFRTR